MDVWWTPGFLSGKYPLISSVVKGCSSTSTFPRFEKSFSIMYEVIAPTTTRLDISTFDAFQGVKHYLSSKNTATTRSSALSMMHRFDIKKDPVHFLLCHRLQTSIKITYKKSQIREKRGKCKDSCDINPAPAVVAKRKRIKDSSAVKSKKRKKGRHNKDQEKQ